MRVSKHRFPGVLAVAIVFSNLHAQVDSPPDDHQVVTAVATALGPDLFPDPGARAEIDTLLPQTHTNEGLARIIENPAFETNAEISGGYSRSSWLLHPSVQIGEENGQPVSGFSLEKSKNGVGAMSLKVSINPEEKTIAAAFNIGPQVKVGIENRMVQRVIAIKLEYRDKEALLHAMGVDPRTLPGASATLKLMDLFRQKTAESGLVRAEPSAVAASAEAIQGQLVPQIFQSALDFKKVTCGSGYTVTLESGTEAGHGEVASKRTMSILEQERLEPGQRPGEGVKFSEVSVSVGLAATGEYAKNKVSGDFSLGVTYSTDPEKKEVEVGPERRRLAEDFRTGRLADASAVVLQVLAPVTQADRISNAVEQVVHGLQEELPKGVKIRFNDNLLGEMLENGGFAEDRDGLIRLADLLEHATEPAERAKLVGGYIRELKAGYQTAIPKRTLGELTLISLRALVAAAERYAENWDQLPAELRTPGKISRIAGYQLDRAHDDVLLIGELIPAAPVLTIDDLVVGVRTVWKENATPFCSLDPDPSDVAGEQHVRVGGVPTDSGFAQVMLDADYLMKRMGANLEKVESPGYESYIDLLRQAAQQEQIDGCDRFWFYPSPLQTGDIELSPDGTLVLFNTGMQVLSEQMLLSHEGLLGTGEVEATADRWAAGLTKALPDLELNHAEFQHLHGLFDLVLLAKTWQRLQVDSPWIARLAALPYQKVQLPTSYKGLKVEVMEDQARGRTYYLMGGVSVRTTASPRAWLVTDQPELETVRAASRDGAGSMVRSVIGRGLVVPAGTRRQASTMDVAAVLALLRRGDVARASTELQKLVTADPFDPEPWNLMAMIALQQRAYETVLTDAGHALELDPDDSDTVLMASSLRFQAHFLTGRTREGLSDAEMAIQREPENPYPHILKGNALVALERTPEARAAYREALRLDPQSVLANVQFGMMEIAEGYVVRGKKLIEKARSQSKLEADLPYIEAAMAFAEIGVAGLGDTEAHLAAARQDAVDVLNSPASDPQSRVSVLTVQAMLALGQDDLPAADGFVQQALELAPSNPGPLLLLVGWAHDQKKDDAARRYLSRAERIAPDFPAVETFRNILGVTP